jgi:hypothetical protein
MKIHKSAVWLSLSALVLIPMVGCWWRHGNSATTAVVTQGQSGKVVQGAVSGATVWADNITSGTSDVRFVIDSDEQGTKTTSAADGTFTLPIQPGYKYVLVSQGGTDTITNQPANTMLAPAGANVVTGLTTLVTLDTTGNLAAAINGLMPNGTSFNSDITASGSLTPAALVLLSSIESAVTTLNQTIQKAATASGATLTPQQQTDIELILYSQIASTFSSLSTASLENTASLAANLQTALFSAETTIQANNSNIKLQNTAAIASSIANNAVAAAAQVVGNATNNTALEGVTASNVQSAPVTSPVNTSITETTVMTTANTAIVNNAINSVSTTDSSNVTATSTPTTYAPPTIAVSNNPSIIGYQLQINASGNVWDVASFQITFSDDMVSTTSGGSNYSHSVLNPANYSFTQGSCTPTSYSSKVVTFTCQPLSSGAFGVTTYAYTSGSGVLASTTTNGGLLVNNTKTFTIPFTTGSTGGTSLNMF